MLNIARAQAAHQSLPELLSTGEVCAIFRRSSRTIRQWCRDGKLTPVRVGRAVFFRAADLVKLLERPDLV